MEHAHAPPRGVTVGNRDDQPAETAHDAGGDEAQRDARQRSAPALELGAREAAPGADAAGGEHGGEGRAGACVGLAPWAMWAGGVVDVAVFGCGPERAAAGEHGAAEWQHADGGGEPDDARRRPEMPGEANVSQATRAAHASRYRPIEAARQTRR